ncbi:MAG: alpha/beta fold hydrolase, partial [bacterium]|nr:alpha/beta fold hydrolase [bacterium]
LASPSLREFATLYILGYSLGGHVVLKFATEVGDRRLRAAAAVCSPLDLERTVSAFDRPARWPYRRYVLLNLLSQYAEVAACQVVPTPLAQLRRVRTLREWDRLTVVPRFGFQSPEDYYLRAGVGSRLDRLRVPALLVAAVGDPMVSAEGIEPALENRGNHLEVHWLRRGGHVSFPADLDLGLPEARGLEAQVIGWLLTNRA